MKAKTLFAASLLIAAAAFATEVNTEYVLGVFPLSVGKEAIINIPWVEAGSSADGTTIAVENIIKTANLSAGDQLYYYDNGSYQAWAVQTGAGGVKEWAPASIASVGGVAASAGAAAKTLARGRALILNRVASYAEDPITIYVVGQNSSATLGSITISPGYTLLAPVAVSGDTNLAGYAWTGAANGDQLILGGTNRYTYKDGAWGRNTYDKETFTWEFSPAATISLPAGSGVYYYRKGSEGFTFDWSLKAAQ